MIIARIKRVARMHPNNATMRMIETRGIDITTFAAFLAEILDSHSNLSFER
jgi:hypothetical protein